MDGSQEADGTAQKDLLAGLMNRLGKVEARAESNTIQVNKAETLIEMHLKECSQRYGEVRQMQQQVMTSVAETERRLGGRIDSALNQIKNLVDGTAGRAYEILKPPEDNNDR